MTTATATRLSDHEVFVPLPGAGASRSGRRAGNGVGAARTDRGVGTAVRAGSPAVRPVRAATRRPSERVHRRRAALALLAVVAVIGLVTGRATADDGGTVTGTDLVAGAVATGQVPEYVVVGEGDTLWDLVLPYTPAGADPAVFVAEVAASSGLDPRALVPGTVIRLP